MPGVRDTGPKRPGTSPAHGNGARLFPLAARTRTARDESVRPLARKRPRRQSRENAPRTLEGSRGTLTPDEPRTRHSARHSARNPHESARATRARRRLDPSARVSSAARIETDPGSRVRPAHGEPGKRGSAHGSERTASDSPGAARPASGARRARAANPARGSARRLRGFWPAARPFRQRFCWESARRRPKSPRVNTGGRARVYIVSSFATAALPPRELRAKFGV
jgi:hypothetical protein